MAFLETIRNFFLPAEFIHPEVITPAPATEYLIRPLTLEHLPEVLRLNIRCFRKGDNYTKHTFDYLLNEPQTLSYRMNTPSGEMVGFAFVMVKDNGSAHITTIGVAPEHRRRGLASHLLERVEESLRNRAISTVMLEVRVSNASARAVYEKAGFIVVQRIGKYYSNGEDCFLMMKGLLPV